MKHFIILLSFLFGICLNASAENLSVRDSINKAAEAEDFIRVSLLYATPGNAIYSLQGHALLRLQSPSNDLDITYTFETAEDLGNVFQVFMGNSEGGFVYAPTEEVVEEYRSMGRGIWEVQLNLSPRQEQKLWQALDVQMQNRVTCRYDYLRTNCSTQIIRAIEEVIAPERIDYNNLPYAFSGKPMAYRNGFASIAKGHEWGVMFWNISLASFPEWENSLREHLLPEFLFNVWQTSSITSPKGDSRPMTVGEPRVLLQETLNAAPSAFSPDMAAVILLSLVVISEVVYFFKRRYTLFDRVLDVGLFAVQTALGVLLLVLSPVVSPISPGWNLLMPILNPLPIVLWMIFRRRKEIKYVYLLFVVVCLCYIVGAFWIPQMKYGHVLHPLVLCFFFRAFVNYNLASGWTIKLNKN